MTMLVLVIVLVAGFLVVYHHALYPFLLKRLALSGRAKRFAKPVNARIDDAELPRIVVVIPCYNEAKMIAEKMRNFAFIDYPADRFQVRFINDGSTDETASTFRKVITEPELHGLDVVLIDNQRNRGKVAVINDAMGQIEADLVVLSDTSALISVDAFRIIAAHMQDESIGVVAGTYRFLAPGSAGEEAYWDYQTKIKVMESALGAAIGVHGALYAIRRSAFTPLRPDTINDDFILPMEIVGKGFRCVYDPTIVAVELEQADLSMDQKRRLRISAGNVQQVVRLSHLLNPKFGAIAFNFASGKFLRVVMPFLLLIVLFGSISLSAEFQIFYILMLAQFAVYGVALARQLLPQLAWPRAINLIHYLVAGHASNGIGALYYLLNRKTQGAWKRVEAASRTVSYIPVGILLAKRLFDLLFASLGVLLTAPLWPLIALMIKLESPGPIFFRQLRVGRSMPDRTELFMMVKFRTMVVDAEKGTGAVWAAVNDPRITRIGNFLRKTRLDELPQLLNVIHGDMSLVGPRPERPGISRTLENAIPFYAERTYFVMPGITGLAQINQGYDTCIEDVKNKLLYDHAYALSLSKLKAWITMDCTVIFKTVWVMVAGRGQ